MKKNKFINKTKSPFKITDKVRVRKSYYTFSEEYPADRLRISRKTASKKNRKKLRIALSIFIFTFLMCLSYFVMSVGLSISSKPVEENKIDPSDKNAVSLVSVFKEKGLRGLYMPYSKLTDKNYVKDFASKIESKNGNCVIIDFKTQDGKLAYSSLQPLAVAAKSNLYDNNTVRDAVSIFKNRDITVIAGIYCFEDNAAAEYNKNIAVKYMNTDVNFRDALDENGRSWLNPYSKKAQNYILGVIEELYKMDIKGFVLHSVQFPEGAKNSATYPGEKNIGLRNSVLKDFIKKVQNKLPKDAVVILAEDASDALSGNNGIYFGKMNDTAADILMADTRRRDETIVVDRKEKFVSIFSMYSNISQNNKKQIFLPLIDMEEYSRYYIYKMRKAGFNSYILIDETGEY